MKKLIISLVGLLTILFSACSSGLSGTYKPSGKNGFGGLMIDQIKFVSSSKAEITAMGTTQEVSYELNGKQLKFINQNGNQILTIDANGCIDGGDIMGKFCKE